MAAARSHARPAPPANETNWLTPVRNGLDWLDGAWSKYVVELDCQTQRDAIYQPIADAAQRPVARWSTVPGMASDVRLGRRRALPRSSQPRGPVGAAGGDRRCADRRCWRASAGCCSRIGRRLRARWTGNHGRRRGRRRVEIAFYRRFESLLARQGLVRAAAQTQREFAAAAGARLASLTGESRLAALPALVADAFYRVRFGRTPLDNLQTQAVEQALAEIAAIRKNTASGKPRPSVAGA